MTLKRLPLLFFIGIQVLVVLLNIYKNALLAAALFFQQECIQQEKALVSQRVHVTQELAALTKYEQVAAYAHHSLHLQKIQMCQLRKCSV